MKFLQAWMTRLESHPRLRALVQFVKFGIVGCSNTLISLAVYQLCLHVFHWHYLLSNLTAFLISVTNAYVWNSRFVFADGEKRTFAQHLKRYAKSLLSYGGTFLLDSALLSLWVELCGISQTLAPVLNLAITIPLNFLLNKCWAFGRKKEESKATLPLE